MVCFVFSTSLECRPMTSLLYLLFFSFFLSAALSIFCGSCFFFFFFLSLLFLFVCCCFCLGFVLFLHLTFWGRFCLLFVLFFSSICLVAFFFFFFFFLPFFFKVCSCVCVFCGVFFGGGWEGVHRSFF